MKDPKTTTMKNQAMLNAFKALGNTLSPGLQEYKDLVVLRALRDRKDTEDGLPLNVVIKRAESAAAATYWSRLHWSRQKGAA